MDGDSADRHHPHSLRLDDTRGEGHGMFLAEIEGIESELQVIVKLQAFLCSCRARSLCCSSQENQSPIVSPAALRALNSCLFAGPAHCADAQASVRVQASCKSFLGEDSVKTKIRKD